MTDEEIYLLEFLRHGPWRSHGAMADNAAGIAACTDGRNYVTQSCSLYFVSNQKEGIIRAEAQVRHQGKSTVLVDVDVTGERGRLLLKGAYSFFCIQ